MPAQPVALDKQWLVQRAASDGSQLALIAAGAKGIRTYSDLLRAAIGYAEALRQYGVKAGDRIGLLADAGSQYVAALHAIALLGAISVPMNTRLTVRELQYQLIDSGAAFLLHDSSYENTADGMNIDDYAPPLPLLDSIPMAATDSIPDWIPLEVSPDQPHSIIYTSGTTGKPKGAVLTRANFYHSAVASAAVLNYQSSDWWDCSLPLFHVGGLSILTRAVIYGFTALVSYPFSANLTNSSLDDGTTLLSAVPTMLNRMLDARGDKPYPNTIRAVLVGGSPVSPALIARCQQAGLPILQTYGMTETCSQAATLDPGEARYKSGSAGRPLDHIEMQIIDGEICVRGRGVSPGYWSTVDGQPQLIPNVAPDGWFHTGDLGYFDQEGYLYVQDRRVDLIISGGENVYPAEIEAVIAEHPAVSEVGVVGLPDEQWGGVPGAAVVLKSEQSLSADALKAYCKARLAKYKLPARIVFVESLPRNAAGKLLRRELRALFQ